MNYWRISELDVANGPGVRVALFVSGCSNMPCKDFCFNKDIQDFKAGKTWDDNAEAALLGALLPEHVSGLTLLGGEPFLNFRELTSLVEHVRRDYGDSKSVWVFSGFEFESIMSVSNRLKLLGLCDVLVDGPFIPSASYDNLRFRGSVNQRILNVKGSLAAGVPVWEAGYEVEKEQYDRWLRLGA